MKKFLILTIIALFVATALQAQNRNSFIALRGGYLNSINLAIESPGSLLLKPNVNSKPGFYIGLSYERAVSRLFTIRNEVNFQYKGLKIQRTGIAEANTYKYNYIGITPTIGIGFVKNFHLFVGPEINVLLNNPHNNQYNKFLEFGAAVRGSYQIKRVGFDVGYFKGINSYSMASEIGPTLRFFNSNWQIGISYNFRRIK